MRPTIVFALFNSNAPQLHPDRSSRIAKEPGRGEASRISSWLRVTSGMLHPHFCQWWPPKRFRFIR
jgi:hypothetical protein